jgi:hypothetical protein
MFRGAQLESFSMPMKTIILIAGLIAVPAVASAQPSTTAADTKIIGECLKKADDAGEFGTACIGLVATPCMKKADNDVARSKACAQRELAVWTVLNEAAAKRVRAGGFKDISTALTESDKGWSQQRDKLCPVFDKIEPGFLPGNAVYCRMQTTAHRVLLLRKLGDAVNEH